MGVPLNHHFTMIFPYKSSILGYPETPICVVSLKKLEGVDPGSFHQALRRLLTRLGSSEAQGTSIIYGLESNVGDGDVGDDSGFP